jgi:hypothetical protein
MQRALGQVPSAERVAVVLYTHLPKNARRFFCETGHWPRTRGRGKALRPRTTHVLSEMRAKKHQGAFYLCKTGGGGGVYPWKREYE